MRKGKRGSQAARLFFILLFIITGGFGITSYASAHPADINFHNYEITLSAEGVTIAWEILPGPLATEILWNQADENLDGEVSSLEAQSWADTALTQITLTKDGEILPLSIDDLVWPDTIQNLLLGDQPVKIFLSANWITSPEYPQQFRFSNQAPNSLHWYKVRAESPLAFSTPEQQGTFLELEFTVAPDENWITAWESGQPEIPGVVSSFGLGGLAEQAAQRSNRQQGVIGILEGLILNNETSPVFLLSAFGLALLLGALHALSPGHGKTVVAAYLVGASGKFYHAVALGTIVTLTHTGSVFALGLATLAASSYLMPANIFPLLEIISGLLILVLGASLLIPRIRDWRKKRQLNREASAPREMVKKQDNEGPTRLVLNQKIEEVGPAHSHEPESGGYIPRGPIIGSPLQGITWRSLFTLGVSGGLVPCPDAIAILLIAVTINRISFGLSLILAFSLGLAVILIVIGLLIVEGRRLFERLRWFDRVAYVMPVVSALLVLTLGGVLTVGAAQRLPPGAFQLRSKVVAMPNWEDMRILYLGTDADNRIQMFTVRAKGGDPVQVTSFPEGVSGFSIAPDSSAVVYAASEDVLLSNLWMWQLDTDTHEKLLDCAPDFCKTTVWSPDGTKLIYERLPNPGDQSSLGISSIWWLDLETGETEPVFQEAAFPAFYPRWSTTGDWLSYSSINPNQVRLYNLTSGETIEIPLDSNPQALWHPDENIILYTVYSEVGEQFLNKLYRYDLDSGERTRLSGQEELDETLPNWSRDGEYISVVRREWQNEEAAIGDQVWVMEADGTNPRQMTFQEEAIHGRADWSPDGKALLYHIYDLSGSGAPTQIQVLVIETGEIINVTAPGTSPLWLP